MNKNSRTCPELQFKEISKNKKQKQKKQKTKKTTRAGWNKTG